MSETKPTINVAIIRNSGAEQAYVKLSTTDATKKAEMLEDLKAAGFEASSNNPTYVYTSEADAVFLLDAKSNFGEFLDIIDQQFELNLVGDRQTNPAQGGMRSAISRSFRNCVPLHNTVGVGSPAR